MLNAQVTWNANSSVIEPDNQLLPVLFPKGLLSNDAIGIGTQPGVGLGLHLKPSSLQNYWPIIAIERTDASQPACVKFVDNQLTGANKGWLTGMHVNTGDYSIQDVESHAIFKISSSQGSLDFNGNFQVNQAGLIHTLAGVQFPDGTIQTTASSGSNLWQQNGSQIYYNNGTVGIGTSNPLFPLHIKNQNAGIILEKNDPVNDFACVKYVDDLQNNQYWATGTVQNREKYYLWNNQHNFESAFTFTKNNRLGIGIGDPIFPLHIKNQEAGIILENTSSTQGVSCVKYVDDLQNNQYWASGIAYKTGNYYLWHNQSYFAEAFTFTKTNRLGIGLSEPLGNLHIESNGLAMISTQNGQSNYEMSSDGDVKMGNTLQINKNHENLAIMRMNVAIPSGGSITPNWLICASNNDLTIKGDDIQSDYNDRYFKILSNGHVGINTATPQGFLHIYNPYTNDNKAIIVSDGLATMKDNFVVYNDGRVYATEIKVAANNPWPDYVFEKDYNLMPLSELKSYIFKNKHLPNMPSASEVKTEGINMEKTLNKQQEKIEELTLYILQLEERLKALEGNGGGK